MPNRIALALAAAVTMVSLPAAAFAQQALDSASAQAMAPFPVVYVVRYLPGPSYVPDRPLLRQDLREHEKYMRRMTENGTIIAAGPTFDETGGIVLIRVDGAAAAAAFVEEDPAVIAGIFAGTATDWRPVFDAGKIFRTKRGPDDDPDTASASPTASGQER